jgi:hypothetical protein
MTLTDRQYEILDQLYFTCSFHELMQQLSVNADTLESELVYLLQNNLVYQMFFDETTKDFVMQEKADLNALSAAAYVISKKGLLIHNSR